MNGQTPGNVLLHQVKFQAALFEMLSDCMWFIRNDLRAFPAMGMRGPFALMVRWQKANVWHTLALHHPLPALRVALSRGWNCARRRVICGSFFLRFGVDCREQTRIILS
jgi:hypothetical protein